MLTYTDKDECFDDSYNDCHENADCINTEGSYTCQCHNSFNGNGVTCFSRSIMLLECVCGTCDTIGHFIIAF